MDAAGWWGAVRAGLLRLVQGVHTSFITMVLLGPDGRPLLLEQSSGCSGVIAGGETVGGIIRALAGRDAGGGRGDGQPPPGGGRIAGAGGGGWPIMVARSSSPSSGAPGAGGPIPTPRHGGGRGRPSSAGERREGVPGHLPLAVPPGDVRLGPHPRRVGHHFMVLHPAPDGGGDGRRTSTSPTGLFASRSDLYHPRWPRLVLPGPWWPGTS